jgi:hypothetical protein
VLRVLRDRGVLPRQPAELFHYLRRVGNASVHVPGSIQSNRDRAELVALRRLGTVEDCAKVVEFLAKVGGNGDTEPRSTICAVEVFSDRPRTSKPVSDIGEWTKLVFRSTPRLFHILARY